MTEDQPQIDGEPEAILSFEEFTARDRVQIPRYNNFILFFYTTGAGIQFREKSFFQKFQQENPVLERRLTTEIMALDTKACDSQGNSIFITKIQKLDADLYEAYKIMKSYGATDTELNIDKEY